MGRTLINFACLPCSNAWSNEMATQYQESISQYVEYFREQGRRIEKVEYALHKKLLYLAALDSIARAAFGGTGTHRLRFGRLLGEIVSWEYRDHVSLPQLQLALAKSHLDSGDLFQYVDGKLSHWNRCEPHKASSSPRREELHVYVNAEVESKAIALATYGELLYTLRNNIVHEFREPGYGVEVSHDTPCPYHHMFSRERHGNSWELVFPQSLFGYIFQEAIQKLDHYLNAESIDPLAQFKLGTMWL